MIKYISVYIACHDDIIISNYILIMIGFLNMQTMDNNYIWTEPKKYIYLYHSHILSVEELSPFTDYNEADLSFLGTCSLHGCNGGINL
jgi:hypothetical protein